MSLVEYSILDVLKSIDKNLSDIAHELRVSNTYNAEAVHVTRDACELIKEKEDGGDNL